MLAWINDYIVDRPEEKDDSDDGQSGGHKSKDNEGTLILDATCAPQNIRFPTDVSLLNEARLNTEEIIDIVLTHEVCRHLLRRYEFDSVPHGTATIR